VLFNTVKRFILSALVFRNSSNISLLELFRQILKKFSIKKLQSFNWNLKHELEKEFKLDNLD